MYGANLRNAARSKSQSTVSKRFMPPLTIRRLTEALSWTMEIRVVSRLAAMHCDQVSMCCHVGRGYVLTLLWTGGQLRKRLEAHFTARSQRPRRQ